MRQFVVLETDCIAARAIQAARLIVTHLQQCLHTPVCTRETNPHLAETIVAHAVHDGARHRLGRFVADAVLARFGEIVGFLQTNVGNIQTVSAQHQPG